MKITSYFSTGAAALALALSSTTAFAATKVETVSFSAAATDTTSSLLSLGLFDPTLGTLDAATLTFSGSLASSSLVANNSAALNLTNVTVSLFGDLGGTLTAGGPTALPGSLDLIAANSFIGSRTFVVLGPGARTAVGPITVTVPAHSVAITAPADLQSLVGQGSFGYSFASHTSARVANQFTSVSLIPSSLSSATLSIQYSYTPLTAVPEPGGWALMLAGLGAGAFVLRRRAQPVAAPVRRG